MKSTFPLVSALGIACVAGIVCAKKEAEAPTELHSAKVDTARSTGTARPWAQALSDIEADKDVVFGTLENGMRYVIYKNAFPKKRVSMRLHVDAGSLNEADDQRGVAHFLEHMVFNGTKHFPDAKKLIPQMQRLGIAFGAHANAYTSFDETVYMLDLPNIDASTLDLGFAVMGDFADGALLSDSEIDEERGVIASEKTSRDSVSLRMFERQFEEIFPNSLLKDRLPIGTSEVIANAPRERFVDFYTRFYTPEKMTFIYTGDIDVAEAEKTIRDTFGAIKNPASPGKKASLGDTSSPAGLQASIITDEELTTSEVSIIRTRPLDFQVDSKAQRLNSLQDSIANQILSRRFSRLAKQKDAKILGGASSTSPFFREVTIGSIDVEAINNDWKAAVPVVEQELRRAKEHGFTESEYNEAVARITNAYEQAVLSAATRKSSDIASSLVKHAHDDLVFSTPETDLAILKENLAQLNAEIVSQNFRKFWDTQDLRLVVTTQKIGDTDKEELKKIFLESQKSQIQETKEKEVTEFAYTTFGENGTIAEHNHIADLDIHQFTLSNGIKVNFKQTDFDKNSVSVIASFGSGLAGMPLETPELETLASVMINTGGLEKHSLDDLQTLLAGKNVGVDFEVKDDRFTLSGTTTSEDFLLQLQLTSAYLTAPGYRPEAHRNYLSILPSYYAQLDHTEQGAISEMSAWMAGNDTRFSTPTLEQAQALTVDQVKAWLAPQFSQHALELSIVGDVELDTVKSTLESTFAALPARPMDNAVAVENRTLKHPALPAEKTFNFDSKIQKAIAIVLWKAADATDEDITKMRRASLLSSILDDRLRVELRENLGIAYSPFATYSPSRTFNNHSRYLAYSPGKPTDTEKVGKIIVELADKLAKEGATEDEYQRALKPKLSGLTKSLRQNGYWLGTVLDCSQAKPHQLEAARTRDADYRSITLEELNALAKQFYVKENSARISIMPNAK